MLGAATLLLAGCGSSEGESGGGASESAAPLKVALITPSAGLFAQYGTDAIDAWQYAADEINAKGGIDGHRIELIKVNTDNTPAATVRAARKVVTQQKAQAISAIISSAEVAALQQQLGSMNAILINTYAIDDVLRGETCSPAAFAALNSTGMGSVATIEALSELPNKRWAVIATDVLAGHGAADQFVEGMKKAGKTVDPVLFVPPQTQDYGSYISQLVDSGADGLFGVIFGTDAVTFMNQASQFKLFDRIKTAAGLNMISDQFFETLGDKALGFHSVVRYSPNWDFPLNKTFVEGWKAKHGQVPYWAHSDNYLGAELLAAAVAKAKSVEPARLRDALNGLTFDSIAGNVTMRPEDHQLLRPTYFGEVIKDPDGIAGLGWKISGEYSAEQTTPQPNPDCKMG